MSLLKFPESGGPLGNRATIGGLNNLGMLGNVGVAGAIPNDEATEIIKFL